MTPRLLGYKVNDNLNDRPNDSRIDRLSDSVKKTFLIINDNLGIQRKRISDLAGKSIPTIDRHIAVLVKEDLIEHREFARKQARKHREILAQVEAELNLPKSLRRYANKAMDEE